MAIRKIVKLGEDDVLRKHARRVDKFDKRLATLLDDMADTLYEADGAGLAAPQVGILKRAVVIDVGEGLIELVNPEILSSEGEQMCIEGCLSVPGRRGRVLRPEKVLVHAQDRKGKHIELEGEGFLANAICHELDHLDGVLYVDKMIEDGRKAIAEMKRLDDNIADPTISAQIVRLQELSGKIFVQVEQNPEKLPQIRKFMNYYLPTTLKILNAYDRMGEQGVAGENISSTMHKVEGMMATIITAFEKQLDNLFGAEAMDISTDMVVLENMMAREGLSDDPLHRTAQQTEPAQAEPDDGGITLEL